MLASLSATRTSSSWRSGSETPGFVDVTERLEKVYDLETKVLALTIPDREAIIRVLDDPPMGLAELRGVLLAEHRGRVRDGLV